MEITPDAAPHREKAAPLTSADVQRLSEEIARDCQGGISALVNARGLLQGDAPLAQEPSANARLRIRLRRALWDLQSRRTPRN